VGIVLALLLIIGGFTRSAGLGIGMLGLCTLVVGGWALVRGRLDWLHVATRRAGLIVAVAGLGALIVGVTLSPVPTRTTDTAASGTLHKAFRVIPPSPSAAPVTETPEAVPPAPTTSAPALPPAPTMAMTCPPGGSVASPLFGEQISATAPYTVAIDYGDGDRYSNDDQHLSAIFSHTYKVAGNFTVSAVLTDAAGQTTTASCVYSWAPPAAAPVGGSSSGGSTSGDDTYTNVDGNQVHVPVTAPVAPPGATAQCRDGSWSFSQHHSGTCSHHGGVAQWLG